MPGIGRVLTRGDIVRDLVDVSEIRILFFELQHIDPVDRLEPDEAIEIGEYLGCVAMRV